jgi:hypothetical protein
MTTQYPHAIAYLDGSNREVAVTAATPMPIAQVGGSGTLTKLQDAASATGNGVTFAWPGGTGEFAAVATVWNGASCTLSKLGPDGATYIPLGADTTLAANGVAIFTCAAGSLRAVISGANPTALTASVTPVY